jgi:hypothetical protein
MARDLKSRLLGQLGPRKALKFFSVDDLGATLDDERLDEFVDLGLRELAETVPFLVTVPDLVPDSANRLTIGAVGAQADRLLAVEELWLDAAAPAQPYKIPAAGLLADPLSRALRTSTGYTIADQYLYLPTTPPFAPAAVSRYLIRFRVVPTEDELGANQTLLRAASLFAAAGALEDISTAAFRETFVRLQGLPENHAPTKDTQLQITFLRARARALLGDYQAAVFL